MIINDERALAYIVKIDDIRPIEGADNIELAFVGGWAVIVRKGEMQPGDKAIYFEIDSKVPKDDERFAFLEPKGFKVKTMKLNRFKVISQGLLLPLSSFPELEDVEVGEDVTKILGVTYIEAEDNESKDVDPDESRAYTKHRNLMKRKSVKWLMKRAWGRKIVLFLFGRKKHKKGEFPAYIKKTDEERVENLPWKINNGITYVATEKLDGTSCSYGLKRIKRNKYEFVVCSRNRVINKGFDHEYNADIYWRMADKYNMEETLKMILETYHLDWVYIQGEAVGPKIQGNPLQLKENDLYCFNLVDSQRGRWPTEEASAYVKESFGLKWVPILGHVLMPATMEDLKEQATRNSVITPDVLREGLVYRSLDGKDSFKNVSNEYLLKHGG